MSESLLTGESIETPNQHIEYLKKNEYKYRRFFKDYESYEIFMMLPVAESDRSNLLQKLHEEERRKLEQIMPTTVMYGAV
jgi:hypothetical protein